jgi:hypothetical protein
MGLRYPSTQEILAQGKASPKIRVSSLLSRPSMHLLVRCTLCTPDVCLDCIYIRRVCVLQGGRLVWYTSGMVTILAVLLVRHAATRLIRTVCLTGREACIPLVLLLLAFETEPPLAAARLLYTDTPSCEIHSVYTPLNHIYGVAHREGCIFSYRKQPFSSVSWYQ